MHSNKRKLLALGLAFSLMLSTLTGTVYAGSQVYEKVESQPIADGVTYQNILRFGDQGWVNINVVRKDLKNMNSALQLVNSAKGVSTRETVPSLAKQVQNPVAAINADFFYLMRPDSPLGVMVKDGKMVSSPVLVKSYNALSVTQNGQASFGTWQNNLSVTTQRGVAIPVSAYNKITWNYRLVTILDRNWGAYSPGVSADYPDMVEIVVADGVVQEVRQGQPAVAIPENGYVLLASNGQGQLLAQSIAAGEFISFNANTSPNLADIRLAVGGGTLLVQNGQIAQFVDAVAGYSSRTALGTNVAGDQLIMVTVDGRHASYKGMDNQQMAALMLELGSFNAMMMDGGGSTTMVRRGLGEQDAEVVTYASDGKLRPVINGLVVSSGAPTGELSGLVLETGQEEAFSGIPVSLTLRGYDTAYSPMTPDPSQVIYTVVEGKGRIVNGRLIPEAPGNLVINGAYQGKTTTKSLKVLADLAGIELEASQSTLNPGETLELSVTGIDKNGYRASLSPEAVMFSDDKGMGTFQTGVYTAGPLEGTTVIRASFGGFSAATAISTGTQHIPLKSLDQYGPSFLSYPATVTGAVGMVSGGQVNANALKLDYDFTGATGTTAAYALLANGGIPMTVRPQKIGVWVYADHNSPHWIRGQIKDKNGYTLTVEFKQGVDWVGWKRLEANVNQTLTMPATLERLYVVEPTAYKTKGTLLFDGLELMNPLTLPKLTASELGGAAKDALNQKPSSYEQKWMVYGGSSNAQSQVNVRDTLTNGYEMGLFTGAFDSAVVSQSGKTVAGTNGGYATATRENELLIFLNNSKNGLRKSDYSQWPWLKNHLETTQKKNVLIFLQKPIWGTGGFTDKMEADLLGDQLSALAEKGTNVYVFYGSGNTSIETRNGVRYLGTGKEKDQFISLYKKDGQILYTVDKFSVKR